MKVTISVATSRDGYVDDSSPIPLRLSSDEDWTAVRRLRADYDAILVGAGTLRADDPGLRIGEQELREERVARGMSPEIVRVAVASHPLDPALRFFAAPGRKIVFAPEGADLGNITAEVVRGDEITARFIVGQLERMGVHSLLVEGGVQIIRMFVAENLFDEFRLSVAPFDVADPRAPRLFADRNELLGRYAVREVRMLGGSEVTVYEGDDYRYVRQAIEVSRNCVPSTSSYSVGAVVVTARGDVFTGYTHETAPHNHAEEEAILKALAAAADLRGAAIYCSMEPCSERKSKPEPCCGHIIRNGLRRVVFALREPANFVEGRGEETLRDAGLEVRVVDELADEVRRVNGHLIF